MSFWRPTLALFLLLLSAAGFAKDVTLRFTVWDGDEALKILRDVCRQFERENPESRSGSRTTISPSTTRRCW